MFFWLDNQMQQGQFGYQVLQIMQTEQGHVLVNLGWLKGDRTRQTNIKVSPLSGQHQLTGHIRLVEQGILLQEQVLAKSSQILIQQIDLAKIANLLDIELLPFVIYLAEQESLGYQKSWQPIVMPPAKHKGYAFQWASLALAWLLLMCWAAYRARKANV